MNQAYREDLSYIHDVGFGHLAQGGATTLISALHQQGIYDGCVVDLGCGSGITAEALTAAGYTVWGIDISPALINIAQTRVPTGEFHVGSLLDSAIPRCVAVAAIGECFNYIFDNNNTSIARHRLFRRVYQALAPDGVFLFDIAEPGRVPGSGVLRTYTEDEDWAVLMTAIEDRQQQQLTRQITTFRRIDELYRRDHEVHTLQLLDRIQISQELQEIGFAVELLGGYDQVTFAASHIGVLAYRL